MTRLTFIVPVHGREDLTQVCLRQLRRTCDALDDSGVEASAVVIGDDRSLPVASELGFATVRRDNDQLGRKFNDGFEVACSPRLNDEPADFVVPCGSDDWVDPVVFQRLPPRGTVGAFKMLAAVNEDKSRLSRCIVRTHAGCGIRIYPRDLIARADYRPTEEHVTSGCDMSTYNRLTALSGKKMPPVVFLDVHPLQIVDWKSATEQLNSYAQLRMYRKGEEDADPFEVLAAHYPAEAIEEMAAL